MSYVTVVGLTAAVLSTVSFFPQLLKTWKTKSAKDISMGMFSIFCVGVFLWLVYGILINNLPVIIANLFTFIQAFIILLLKNKYK
jgi:MtN3 and saliva related transmembrane protein